MPPPAGTLRVGRYFLALLVILAALYSLVFFSSQSNTPKLGLDLEGGAQIIFRAQTNNGQTPSPDSMRVARQILTDRVNGTGVSAAEVVQQGADRIVVSVPGKSVEDIAGIGGAAQLNLRSVVMPAVPIQPPAPAPSGSASSAPSSAPTSGSTGTGRSTATPRSTTVGTPSASPSANGFAPTSPTPTPTATGATPTPAGTAGTASPSPSPSGGSAAANPFDKLGFALPTSSAAFAGLPPAQQQALTAALRAYQCPPKSPPDDPKKPMVSCGQDNGLKYVLGPVIVPGTEVSKAAAVPPNVGGQGGSVQWTVSIDLKSSGQTEWAKYTAAHHSTSATSDVTSCTTSAAATAAAPTGTPCAEFVAFTLDGKVVSSPHNEATINGTTSVSGSFNETTATALANQLKYGALPLSFNPEQSNDVSPTLGTSQLKAGLLAGGIGLALVVLYSLIYYRGLGLVTIASLTVSGGLTYACLVILGRQIGFTLTLSGIAGFIVAVGITADSFVVFFERIKDEVHEGRSMRTAVPRAWTRARRTIISADFVSLLAAGLLYYFAAGDVRGFAFTLGLSTVLDLVVVFMFTHPLISLLARSAAFGSPRFTGLNSVRTGPVRRVSAARTAPVGVSTATSTSTAVLEREPGPTVEFLDDETEAPSDTPAERSAAERANERGTAERADGRNAAERAAARRGRSVRAAKAPPADEPVDAGQDVDPVIENPTAPVAEQPTAERPADADGPADNPADAADTDDRTPAAERAAARRARLRSRSGAQGDKS